MAAALGALVDAAQADVAGHQPAAVGQQADVSERRRGRPRERFGSWHRRRRCAARCRLGQRPAASRRPAWHGRTSRSAPAPGPGPALRLGAGAPGVTAHAVDHPAAVGELRRAVERAGCRTAARRSICRRHRWKRAPAHARRGSASGLPSAALSMRLRCLSSTPGMSNRSPGFSVVGRAQRARPKAPTASHWPDGSRAMLISGSPFVLVEGEAPSSAARRPSLRRIWPSWPTAMPILSSTKTICVNSAKRRRLDRRLGPGLAVVGRPDDVVGSPPATQLLPARASVVKAMRSTGSRLAASGAWRAARTNKPRSGRRWRPWPDRSGCASGCLHSFALRQPWSGAAGRAVFGSMRPALIV